MSSWQSACAAAAKLSREDEQSLRSGLEEFRVPLALALLGRVQRRAIAGVGAVRRDASPGQRADERGVAAQRFPVWRGPVHDEVEPP